jgi:uncharacterized transporter YbjL
MILLVHLIGALVLLALLSLGVCDLCVVGWALRNDGSEISGAVLWFGAGLGLLVLYAGVQITRGIYSSFRSGWRAWRSARDLPWARIVSR